MLNIYHFFVRKNALWRCLENLRDTFTIKKPAALDFKFMIECLLLGLMIGIVLMPGGHFQMQFYSRYFIPLLIHMVGLPIPAVFWMSQYVFPFEHVPPFVKAEIVAVFKQEQITQHLFCLALTIWLITVGPWLD